MTQLILGTAQFGAGYGITNASGRLDDETVREILSVAESSGIDLFDTAPDYGDAQQRLAALRGVDATPRYVTKFGLPSRPVAASDLLDASIAALDVTSLYGILFHRVDDLRDERAADAWTALQAARAEGRVARIGASIYDTADLALVVERFPDLDLIQIPGNLLDRRLLDAPQLAELSERGVEIHVRSAYLQGLLLTAPEAIPEHLADLRPSIERIRDVSAASGIPVLELALGFLKRHPLVDAVLVGAIAGRELRDTVAAWDRLDESGRDESIDFPALDPELLDPRGWAARGAS